MEHWSTQFDDDDLAEIAAYLEKRGRTAFDPGTSDERHPDDVFLWLTREQTGFQTYGMRKAKRQDGRPFRCYPVIIDSPDPNAFACELDRLHIIGLNAGMATVAYEFAAYTLSRSDTFTGIGNLEREVDPPLPPDAMLGYWMFDRVATALPSADPVGAEIIPLHPVRKEMAYYLSHLLMRFAWFHEVFHCLNGHCACLRASGRASELREMPADLNVGLVLKADVKVEGVDVRRMLRTFEFDADSCALNAMISLQLSGTEPLTPFDEEPLSTRLRLTVAASWLMTLLFAQSGRRGSAVSYDTHPPPEHRLKSLLATFFADEGQGSKAFREVVPLVLDDVYRLSRHFGSFLAIDSPTTSFDVACWTAYDRQADCDLQTMHHRTDHFVFRP